MNEQTRFRSAAIVVAAIMAAGVAGAVEPPVAPTVISGVLPRLAMVADHDPRS